MSKIDYLGAIVRARGVETVCHGCQGLGVTTYPDTSTWHHAIGGQALTDDVCDYCWGSGDSNRRWLDHRVAFREIASAKIEIDQLKKLLTRIAEWDHLDTAADGPYWQAEILKALGKSAL